MFAIYLIGIFGLSVLLAFAFTRRKSPTDIRKCLQLTSLTLRGTGGVYRSRISKIDSETFTIDAPLSQNVYLPLRVGESLRCEAGFDNQVAIFRAEIVSRCGETHTFQLKPTTAISHVNRRIEARNHLDQWLPCKLDGQPAVLIDFSNSGAKVITRQEYSAGDLLRIEIPLHDEPIIACVLEVKLDQLEGRLASQLRLAYNA